MTSKIAPSERALVRVTYLVVVMSLAGCGRIGFDAAAGDAAGFDDSGAVDACTWSSFGAPTVLSTLSSPAGAWAPTLTADGLTLVFSSIRAGGTGGIDLYMASRTTLDASFGPATELTQLDSASADDSTTITADGLTLYMTSDRGGSDRLYRATRASTQNAFGPPSIVGELASEVVAGPTISADGAELFYTQSFSGYLRIMRSQASGGVFMPPQPVTELDVPLRDEGFPSLASDHLTLYFMRITPTDSGDLMVATRPSRNEAFGPAVPFDDVNTVDKEDDPLISFDGTTLMWVLTGASQPELVMTTRACQ